MLIDSWVNDSVRDETSGESFLMVFDSIAIPGSTFLLPNVSAWIRALILETQLRPGLALNLINRLALYGDPAGAARLAKQTLDRGDITTSDRAYGEYVLAEATLQVEGFRAAEPFFEAAIRTAYSAIDAKNSERLARALEEALKAHRRIRKVEG